MQQRIFVVGPGEVGRRLAGALERAGWTVRTVTRTEGWEPALRGDDPAPRLIAVREEQLGPVLERFGPGLRERLVLVQNGFLEAVHGDLGPVTRGLIYFTSKGDFYRRLCPSPFYGPLAPRLVEALESGGVPAELVEEPDECLRAMIIKGIWNCVIGLPLVVRGVDLGGYLARFRDELDEMAEESVRAAGARYGVELEGRVAVQKILDTTAELGHVRGGKKALPWRNGAIARFGRLHDVPTPVNDDLLRAVGFDPEKAEQA